MATVVASTLTQRDAKLVADILDGVEDALEHLDLQPSICEELAETISTRKIEIEVSNPTIGTNRIALSLIPSLLYFLHYPQVNLLKAYLTDSPETSHSGPYTGYFLHPVSVYCNTHQIVEPAL